MGEYIVNNRPNPAPGPMPKSADKANRGPTRAKRARMKDDAIYLGTIDEYFHNNPRCCGCGEPATSFHHIARGSSRGNSLTNTDLGMGACAECHKQWDDKGCCSVAQQFATKFCAILHRYQEITRTKVSVADVVGYMTKP